MSSSENCCAKIAEGAFTTNSCRNKAKMTHEGKHYCGIHDPVKKAAREAETEAMYRREEAESDAHQRVALAAPAMLATLKDARDHIYKRASLSAILPNGTATAILNQIKNIIDKAEGK